VAITSGNDVVASGHGVVPVSHHLFFLTDGSNVPVAPLTTANGLVDVQPGAAVIRTGIHSGVVRLTVEARSRPPQDVPTGDWEAIVEVSLDAPAGRMAVSALMDDVTDPFPPLTQAGPGSYRARVHARGRDTDIDSTAFEPVEDYLIQVWPAPPAPQHVYGRPTATARSCSLCSRAARHRYRRLHRQRRTSMPRRCGRTFCGHASAMDTGSW
jgi:hypothetical protein